MYFFTFDLGILRLVEKADGCQCPTSLHDEDFLHIRGIAKADALACEPVIHFVFNLVDDDDTVSRDTTLDLQKEVFGDVIIGKAADLLRSFKEPVLGRHPAKGGMRGLVVLLYKNRQAATQLIQGMEIPHIKCSHPLIFHGAEPAFIHLSECSDKRSNALIEKVNNFLMELGTGFAYMGREVRIEVGDTEKFIDMLFYNTQRHCYVVVEIKTGKFDSSYAGQLGIYVVAVNHQMKTEADNPTLGLLICKDMDKVKAQYALESTSQPLGISSYELSKLIPEEFRGSMPTIEEIEAELNE